MQEKFDSADALKILERKFIRWNKENFDYLKKIFVSKSIAAEYAASSLYIGSIFGSDFSLTEKHLKIQNEIQVKLDKLVSIKESLDLLKPKEKKKQKVYFVHNSDNNIAHEILDFIEKHNFKPIILKDLAKAGKTLIDEIENVPDINYAIVVLTLDEIGGKTRENLHFRASQNVILELGIFVGKLGRNRVSGIRDESIELPDDFHGFEYIVYDAKGKWQLQLTKQLKAAGFKF